MNDLVYNCYVNYYVNDNDLMLSSDMHLSLYIIVFNMSIEFNNTIDNTMVTGGNIQN